MTFFCRGVPVPQGSKRIFAPPGQHARLVDVRSESLKAWRTAIAQEARLAGVPFVPAGAVSVEAVFVLCRPPSVSARKRPEPAVAPDVDKLLRALLDALTGIAYRDDAQVTCALARKTYTCTAWPEPGVLVTVIERKDEPE